MPGKKEKQPYTKIYNAILDMVPSIGMGPFLVYCILRRVANNNVCYYSLRNLAKAAGCNIKTILEYRQRLLDIKLIKLKAKGNSCKKANTYELYTRIDMAALWEANSESNPKVEKKRHYSRKPGRTPEAKREGTKGKAMEDYLGGKGPEELMELERRARAELLAERETIGRNSLAPLNQVIVRFKMCMIAKEKDGKGDIKEGVCLGQGG